jgi:cell division protein FtsQ
LQQVGRDTFLANAEPIDPRLLPVPLRRPGRRAMVGLSHAWVLHGYRLVPIAILVSLLALAGVLYALREPIAATFFTLVDLVEGEIADAGLAVGKIEITGQSLASETDILIALGLEPGVSTLGFDLAAAHERVAALPAIESVSIRKQYPSDLVVTVTERVPVARWRVDGVTFLVDAAGEQIGTDRGAYTELPLVIGDGAADDALIMIRALDVHPDLKANLVALSRIADRRWDMIFSTGLRVQLPELGVGQALRRLVTYQADYQLLDRDVSTIDLRVQNLVAVRPNLREEDPDES